MKHVLITLAACSFALTACSSAPKISSHEMSSSLTKAHVATKTVSVKPTGNWALTKIGTKKVNANIGTDLTFGPKEQISGAGGCNRYFGTAKIDKSSISFGRAGSTMMACEEAKMKQEGTYLNSLTKVTNYQINGDMLIMTDSAGKAVLTFKKK